MATTPSRPGALVRLEPLPGHLDVGRGGARSTGAGPRQRLGQQLRRSVCGTSSRDVSASARRSKATKEAGVRSARVRTRSPGGMDALGERVEVEPALLSDHDLPVQHAPRSAALPERLHQLGEISGQRLSGAAAQFDLVPVAEHDRPEAVPLRLVLHAGRDGSPTDLASIGFTGGITGRSMSRFCAPLPDRPASRVICSNAGDARCRRSYRGAHGRAVELEVASRTVRLSSPDKVYFPERGFTKLDLARYYSGGRPGHPARAAGPPHHPGALPATGWTGESFFQKRAPKNLPGMDPDRRTSPSPADGAPTRCAPPSRRPSCWAAQFGTLTFHPWPVRRHDLDRPDELRIDLDPQPPARTSGRGRAAHELRAVLDEFGGLRGWPKTSGGRGCTSSSPSSPGGPSPRSGAPPSPSAGRWSAGCRSG